MQKTWLNDFKAYIVEENLEKIEEYTKNIPQFSSIKDMQEALFLTAEALKLLYAKKKTLSANIEKLKQVKAYTN